MDRVCNGTNPAALGTPDSSDPGDVAAGCPAVPSRCERYDHDGNSMTSNEYACRLFGPNELCGDGGDPEGPVHTQCGIDCASTNECPAGSTCENTKCVMPCMLGDADDETMWVAGTCGAVVHCTLGLKLCDPASTECNATRTAELWDPECGTWTELDAQVKSRMYHSSALLLPDRSVITMGGGHVRSIMIDQENAEIFTPEYGPPGTADVPVLEGMLPVTSLDDRPHYQYEEKATFVLGNGGEDIVARDFTLVRLGSATHGFDMEQRFVPLTITDGVHDDDGPLTVQMPKDSNLAPPGYYMLFLRTATGEVSSGHYIHLSAEEPMAFVCAATTTLAALETSCEEEPTNAECPSGDEQQNRVDLPVTEGREGRVDGWHVYVPGGAIGEPEAPTAEELAYLDSLCVAACEAHWSSDPALSANCDHPDAFEPPEPVYREPSATRNYILEAQKQGGGIFASQELDCQLDSTCCEAFDEDLCAAGLVRATPAGDPLEVGEEYKTALGTASQITIITTQGMYSSSLSGSVGYSFCRDGNATAPCPFYLGSFFALASSTLYPALTCADSSTARLELSNLSFKLGQPAFGIDEEATTSIGFPKGSLVFDASFDINEQHFTTRQPNTSNVIVTAAGNVFSANNLTLNLTLPCNTSFTTLQVQISVSPPTTSGGGSIGRPPAVTNSTSATGACNASRSLIASVTDPDSDAGAVRWRVDGVLMAPGTSSMIVSEPHTLEAIARDSRGATTTATKELSCN
jgi:hypothetical protein